MSSQSSASYYYTSSSSSASYYAHRLSHLRDVVSTWSTEDGKKLSIHALDMAEALLKGIDPDYLFSISPCLGGGIYVEGGLWQEDSARRMIGCVIDDTGILSLQLMGFPSELGKEKTYSLPSEISACAEFITKCLHL